MQNSVLRLRQRREVSRHQLGGKCSCSFQVGVVRSARFYSLTDSTRGVAGSRSSVSSGTNYNRYRQENQPQRRGLRHRNTRCNERTCPVVRLPIGKVTNTRVCVATPKNRGHRRRHPGRSRRSGARQSSAIGLGATSKSCCTIPVAGHSMVIRSIVPLLAPNPKWAVNSLWAR